MLKLNEEYAKPYMSHCLEFLYRGLYKGAL